MIIQLGFYKRNPSLSVEEYRYLWSGVYGPLYGKHPELTRHLRRYVQHQLSPVDDNPADQMQFDGMSEAWFETIEDKAALCREPIFLEKIAPFAASFIDIENSRFTAYDSQLYHVGRIPPLVGS